MPRLECASAGGQSGRFELTPLSGFGRMEAMTKGRSHGAALEQELTEEFIAGQALRAPSKRRDISRQLFRI
jgi:hypothetical protein